MHMLRTCLLVVLLGSPLVLSRPASAQVAGAPAVRLQATPPADLPVRFSTTRTVVLGDQQWTWNVALPSDTLNAAQVMRRMARLYALQADILVAQTAADTGRVADLLEQAMTHLGRLVEQPTLMSDARFRELYRTVVTEYEQYYGVSDTLDLQRGDIYAFRADAFAAIDDDALLLERVMPPTIAPADTEVPMVINRLVERSVAFLLKDPQSHVYPWLSRSATYFPMIEHILAEEDAPDELKYLALIESGLNPQARSWARAVGMWQFMAATGRQYGLDVNTWVDERRDPEKATRAAARHMNDLYERFGDWHLALAAYNCGSGNVRKAQRRARARGEGQDFWSIYPYLPRETRGYVPMYIAAALVTSNPEAFSLRPPTPGPRYEYDYVPVQGMLELRDIARLADTDVETIRALNPELRRSVLPPSRDAYYVRLPLGSYAQFAEGYAQLPKSERRTAVEYVVRRGDALGKIAGRYGVSVRELRRANDLRGSLIRIGQRLIIPVPSYEPDNSQTLAVAEGEPAIVRYASRPQRPIAVERPLTLARANNAQIPVRQASMTRSGASDEEEAPKTLADKEPREEAAATKAAEKPAAAPAAEAKRAEPSTPAGTRKVYTVRRGDTLGEIAEDHGVRASDLRRWNSMRGSRIRAGQRLYIYLPEGQRDPAEAAPTSYRVRSGDTLSGIAARYGVSMRDLRRWNDLSGSRIRAGQELIIQPEARGDQSTTYRVRSGDSLYLIAQRHSVTVSDLKRWNGLRSNKLMPGQTLKIYK